MIEKAVVALGFGIAWTFFVLALILANNPFIWGVPVGLTIMTFGWIFWEDENE